MHACMLSRSVVFDSVRRYGQQPARLPRPQASPGKNTGAGCHSLLQDKVYYSLNLHRTTILYILPEILKYIDR